MQFVEADRASRTVGVIRRVKNAARESGMLVHKAPSFRVRKWILISGQNGRCVGSQGSANRVKKRLLLQAKVKSGSGSAEYKSRDMAYDQQLIYWLKRQRLALQETGLLDYIYELVQGDRYLTLFDYRELYPDVKSIRPYTERAQRKRCQEKFRKRSKSLFYKVEESIRLSSNPNWNLSVNDLIKVVEGDKSDSAVEGDNAGLFVEEAYTAKNTLVKADARAGSVVTIDLSYMDKDRVTADALKGLLNEIAKNQGWMAVNVYDSNSTIVERPSRLGYTAADSSSVSKEATTALLEARAVDSGMERGAVGIRGTDGTTDTTARGGSHQHLGELAGLISMAVQLVEGTCQAKEAPGEGEVACLILVLGPETSGYNMMDLDTPGNQVGIYKIFQK
ncbi:hypothetical protein OIDMADRAFT_36091 [Oidiodendron maius Zn]|uniref:Uncharacterized protein n=1 Tax=Oidiodendron maius (strain Zn) TaxID=913774 RepID=A0A0C3C2G3_OIDMZ|nr:hypothetical protein OIDMADRAFT_36091 [Oidiodendron maius Zn]